MAKLEADLALTNATLVSAKAKAEEEAETFNKQVEEAIKLLKKLKL